MTEPHLGEHKGKRAKEGPQDWAKLMTLIDRPRHCACCTFQDSQPRHVFRDEVLTLADLGVTVEEVTVNNRIRPRLRRRDR